MVPAVKSAIKANWDNFARFIQQHHANFVHHEQGELHNEAEIWGKKASTFSAICHGRQMLRRGINLISAETGW